MKVKTILDIYFFNCKDCWELLDAILCNKVCLGKKRTVRIMVFNITFNNISVISWLAVLLMEETGVPGENHRPAASR
jgi:hypothetical protein